MFGEGRARHPGGVFGAGLMGHYNVGVTLHKYTGTSFANLEFCFVNPVEHLTLIIQQSLRGVDILCEIFVRNLIFWEENSAAKADYLAVDIKNRKYYAAPESVRWRRGGASVT